MIEEAGVSPLYENLLLKEQIQLLFDKTWELSPQQASIILSILNGVSPTEYAKNTNKNYGSIISAYNQACKRLKSLVEAEEESK